MASERRRRGWAPELDYLSLNPISVLIGFDSLSY